MLTSLNVSNIALSKQIDVKSEVGVHLEVDGQSQMNKSAILFLTQHDNNNISYFVDRASCYDSWQMTNLTHSSFLCIYFNSLHVSSNLVLIIRRINCINTTSGICYSVSVTVSCAGRKGTLERSPTRSNIYRMLYWYNWFSWWWARGCSKRVVNCNKYIEKNCASSWPFTKNDNKSVTKLTSLEETNKTTGADKKHWGKFFLAKTSVVPSYRV